MIPNSKGSKAIRVVGLTGGIASGKSTVSKMFRELGANIIDADELARRVVEPGSPALAEIAKRFPDTIEGGSLQRSRLASHIFSYEQDRADLNSIIHPRIQEQFERHRRKLAAEGVPVAIYDAALLIENRLHEKLDGVILVAVPEHVQISRLQARDGLTVEAARQRIAAQLSVDEKRRHARWIVDNSADLRSTQRQVLQIWNEVQHES